MPRVCCRRFRNRAGWREALQSILHDRIQGRPASEIARAFQRGIATGLTHAIESVAVEHGIRTTVLSGGVFQNGLLLEDLQSLTAGTDLVLWTNSAVPANDGGISLGQAALVASLRD